IVTASGLNLEAIRAFNLPHLGEAQSFLERMLAFARDFRLSRRQFLAGAGAGVAALPSTAGLLENAGDAFEVIGDSRRLAFAIGGRELWIIDPASFDGPARLRVQRRSSRLRLPLHGALYPGTQVPADFDASIRRGVRGWRMRA